MRMTRDNVQSIEKIKKRMFLVIGGKELWSVDLVGFSRQTRILFLEGQGGWYVYDTDFLFENYWDAYRFVKKRNGSICGKLVGWHIYSARRWAELSSDAIRPE